MASNWARAFIEQEKREKAAARVAEDRAKGAAYGAELNAIAAAGRERQAETHRRWAKEKRATDSAARERNAAAKARGGLMANAYRSAPAYMGDLPELPEERLKQLQAEALALHSDNPHAWYRAQVMKERTDARAAGAAVVGSGAGWNAFRGAAAANASQMVAAGWNAFRGSAARHAADVAAAPPSPFAAITASGGAASGGAGAAAPAASGGAGAAPAASGGGEVSTRPTLRMGGGYRKSKSQKRSKSRSQKRSKSQKKSRKSQKKSRSRR